MALSIPISIISTFVLMYFTNMTLNMISLGGIALGIGMLVDNSIVVIENISRLKKNGLSSIDCAIYGTKEVASAITASTLTTICVFLPIVFVDGIAATIFKEMALTVTFSLISSLLVAFTLVPLLASRLINDNSFKSENKLVLKLKDTYSNILAFSLNNKKYILGILIFSIVLGVFSFTQSGIEFFPTTDQGIVYVDVTSPKGSSTDVINSNGENVIEKIGKIKEVKTTSLSVSDSDSTATIMLVLDDIGNRDKSDSDIVSIVREKVKDIPGVEINVNSANSMMTSSMSSSPISITVSGNEFETLEKISNDIIDKISKVEGAIDIKLNNEKSSQEINIKVDKQKAAKYGITNSMVAQIVNQRIQSSKITSFTVEEKHLMLQHLLIALINQLYMTLII